MFKLWCERSISARIIELPERGDPVGHDINFTKYSVTYVPEFCQQFCRQFSQQFQTLVAMSERC